MIIKFLITLTCFNQSVMGPFESRAIYVPLKTDWRTSPVLGTTTMYTDLHEGLLGPITCSRYLENIGTIGNCSKHIFGYFRNVFT